MGIRCSGPQQEMSCTYIVQKKGWISTRSTPYTLIDSITALPPFQLIAGADTGFEVRGHGSKTHLVFQGVSYGGHVKYIYIAFPRNTITFPRNNIAFSRNIIRSLEEKNSFPRNTFAFFRNNIALPWNTIAFCGIILHSFEILFRFLEILLRENAKVFRGNEILFSRERNTYFEVTK